MHVQSINMSYVYAQVGIGVGKFSLTYVYVYISNTLVSPTLVITAQTYTDSCLTSIDLYQT